MYTQIYLALEEWHKQRAAGPRRGRQCLHSVYLQGRDCSATQSPALLLGERSPPPPPYNKSLGCNCPDVTCIIGTVKPLKDKAVGRESHRRADLLPPPPSRPGGFRRKAGTTCLWRVYGGQPGDWRRGQVPSNKSSHDKCPHWKLTSATGS